MQSGGNLDAPASEGRPPAAVARRPLAILAGAQAVPRSQWRAWGYLLWLSLLRQARVRQMVWIALSLLVFSVTIVALISAAGRWDDKTFSEGMVFIIFLGFLLPTWSLSFATEALGGERESRSLVWLLTRPLSRPGVYLAKFLALLPWTLGFNMGGFALLCLVAGAPGRVAFQLFWPAVLAGTVAYSALFHLMAAAFRRSAVVAIVYTFFLESFLGSMPGQMKRISVSFYTRCLMFETAEQYGLQPEKPSVYMPVDSVTAWVVLVVVTLLFLAGGMFIFARSEYRDES